MALQDTNLLIEMANLPAVFLWTPHQLAAGIVARLKIKSPVGMNMVVFSDTEPTSNQGLWINGKKPYVWDDSIARYAPLDVSDSVDFPFWVSDAVPSGTDPAIWLRTKSGRMIGWYYYDGVQWLRDAQVVNAGPTALRPADPVNLEQYYDSDISVLLWYERGMWRTVAGVPGDVKHVYFETLTEALRYNPGWDVLGSSQVSWRGRYISQATKDGGSSPETTLSVPADVAERAAREIFGETDFVKIDAASPVPYPPTIALWTLYKL